jgi:GNAT superfamily N-acetyltransferase
MFRLDRVADPLLPRADRAGLKGQRSIQGEGCMVLIRRATVRDAAYVGRFVDALLVELSGSPSKYDERRKSAEHLLALEERIFGFLAFELEEPIGAMMISESAAIYAGGMFGVITELYVTSERRSAGVAKMLVDTAASLGRRRGWRQIEVGAPHQPAWERSLNFYLRAGFVEIGPRLKLPL